MTAIAGKTAPATPLIEEKWYQCAVRWGDELSVPDDSYLEDLLSGYGVSAWVVESGTSLAVWGPYLTLGLTVGSIVAVDIPPDTRVVFVKLARPMSVADLAAIFGQTNAVVMSIDPSGAADTPMDIASTVNDVKETAKGIGKSLWSLLPLLIILAILLFGKELLRAGRDALPARGET